MLLDDINVAHEQLIEVHAQHGKRPAVIWYGCDEADVLKKIPKQNEQITQALSLIGQCISTNNFAVKTKRSWGQFHENDLGIHTKC